MTKKLETILLDCTHCNKETPHTYRGYHGVVWKPIYIYGCKICGMTQHSKIKYDMKKEEK